MTAWLVLGSIGLLLALLVHGRVAPAPLFTGLATCYYFAGLLDQKTWLTSYTNPALAMLVLLLLVSMVVERAPVLERVSDRLLRGSPGWAVVRFTSVTTLFSAFLNNTAVVGALLGVVTRQRHHPASLLLIPLSFAAIVGGITTLVGTSTNLVVSSLMVNAGLPPLGMFDPTWVGVPVALVCVGVMALGVRLLPRHEADDRELQQAYFLEARVDPASSLIGRSIEQNRLRNLEGLFLLEILREGRLISPVAPTEVIEAGDVLIFTGEIDKVQTLQRFDGLQVFGMEANALLRSNLLEVVISSQSDLANRTLREVDFRTMFDAGVVGIRRGDKRLTGQLGRVPLHVGDSLLLAVGPDFAHHRNIERNFHLVGGTVRPRLTPVQSRFTLGGFAAVIALSGFEIVPLFTGLLVLMIALVVSGLLTLGEMRRRFPFDLVLTIGSSLAIASVLENSGAAELMAGALRALYDGHGVLGAFVGIYLLTVLLTELVTNNAAAALAFPIALSTARAFDADPMPFIMAVLYGASAGFLIPFGYQTHLMVYSPGRYRMMDFVRVGLPVSIAYGATVLLLVPVFFPFTR
ncbi:TrkA-C domain protein [Methyloversatilis universalis FAM5]|uniref:TrkA-C domain protein n=1 Tax=Methyloversatilis universalis (strain ATCC BAA-1314 / DSM 25237 / JCM 13912 / CCUG 52030 / FAM5) TaxID=1000565 RepID=F5R970_METUF|nr:SLC13 family permease [Methyloversatilis universalis]EGK72861.1 TrkA-C domain protein [Methyloversatilis universalis FAM5]